MAFKTLTIKESTYRKLVDWKDKDESFSDLLDREFDRKIQTSKDLLEWAREAARTGNNSLRQRKDSPYRPKK